jgi:hypothetical protein
MRTKVTQSEPFVNALPVDTSTALLVGTLAQIEKQLKLIPFSSQNSNFKHEIIYTRHKTNV